jgi:hypothetical protein
MESLKVMTAPNKHDWSALFIGDVCRLCLATIPTGTGKAGHAQKHQRENKVKRSGAGTAQNPFRYEMTGELPATCPRCCAKLIEKGLAIAGEPCPGCKPFWD